MASVRSAGGPQHLLAVVPVPEPKSLQRLREEYPHVKITWIDQKCHPFLAWKGIVEVPVDVWETVTHLFTVRTVPAPGQAPNLRYLHCFAAGIEHLHDAAPHLYSDPSLPMTASLGAHGPQMAEWVLLTYLTVSHRMRELERSQAQSHFALIDDYFGMPDLVGQRVGILGYGSIGRAVGRAFAVFGARIIAYTASPRPTLESRRGTTYCEPGTGDPEGTIPEEWASGTTRAELHAFLSRDLDVLVLALPSTPLTRGLLGEPELALLARRRHAFISSVGRGDVLDQDALLRYLAAAPPTAYRAGGENENPGLGDKGALWLRGAALDVTDPEPLPKESGLWRMVNCVVSPHVSCGSRGYAERAVEVLRVNMGRLERGEGLLNGVDRGRGY